MKTNSNKALAAAAAMLIGQLLAVLIPDIDALVMEESSMQLQILLEQLIIIALTVAGVWAVPNKEIKL